MDWHDFVSSEDAQGIAKWIGIVISSILVFLGMERWYTSRKTRRIEQEAKARAALDARFAHKAELQDVEDIHNRIRRHKEANEKQVEVFKEAVAELKEANARHKRIEEKIFDKVDANASRATDRHIQLLSILATKGYDVTSIKPDKPEEERHHE